MDRANGYRGPSVRLVANAHQGREESKVAALRGGGQAVSRPDVRLAWFDIPAVNTALDGVAPCAPAGRLAHKVDGQGDGCLTGVGGNGVPSPRLAEQDAPALLVSYYYLEPFLKNQSAYRYRDWVMDSGAFSAHNSGASIDLSRYVDKCLELLGSDPTLTEVFSLDVIPKDQKPATVQRAAEQSARNTEEMWRQGVPAIPTFHRGEAEEFLFAMAKEYPKIAIGGVALLRGDRKFLFCEQVFARVWPKKVHGLGMASEELVYSLPFHSVDATNWELAPCAFGNWQKFGSMSVRGSNQDLRSQVKHYLAMEAKARARWGKEMALLGGLKPSPAKLGNGKRTASSATACSVRLAPDAGSADGKRVAAAIGGRPEKRKEKKEAVLAGVLDEKWRKNWWE